MTFFLESSWFFALRPEVCRWYDVAMEMVTRTSPELRFGIRFDIRLCRGRHKCHGLIVWSATALFPIRQGSLINRQYCKLFEKCLLFQGVTNVSERT